MSTETYLVVMPGTVIFSAKDQAEAWTRAQEEKGLHPYLEDLYETHGVAQISEDAEKEHRKTQAKRPRKQSTRVDVPDSDALLRSLGI